MMPRRRIVEKVHSAQIFARTAWILKMESPEAAGDGLNSPPERTFPDDRHREHLAPVSLLTLMADAMATCGITYSSSCAGSSSESP